MTDPLVLLDEAIDRLASAVSSRCSRSGEPVGMPPGTVKPLKIRTVPVVPVVPGQNGQICGANFSRRDIPCLDSSRKKTPHASTILKRTGTTGTTGTGPINQRLIVPESDSEIGRNGNNGNCHRGMEQPGFHVGMAGELGDGTRIIEDYLVGTTLLNQDHEHPNESRLQLLDGPKNHHLGTPAAIHLPDDVPPQLPLDQPRIDLSRVAGVPQDWLAGVGSMSQMIAPAGIPPADWDGFVHGAPHLLVAWGAQLAALGWTASDLFALHRMRPMDRYDHAGLVRFLGGSDVVAVTRDTAVLRCRSGTIQTFYRRSPSNDDWVMIWELN